MSTIVKSHKKSTKHAVTSPSDQNASAAPTSKESSMSPIPASIAAVPAAPTVPTVSGVPTIMPADILAFSAAVVTFAEVLGGGQDPSDRTDTKRLVRARKNASDIVPAVANLSTKYKIASPSFPVAAILARQEIVKTLAPVMEQIVSITKLVDDVSMVAQAEAWEGAMVTYGLLKSEARLNKLLKKSLQPLREEMRIKYVTAEGTKTVKRSRAAVKKPAAGETVVATEPSATTTSAPVAAAPTASAPAPVSAAQPSAAHPATPVASANPAVVTGS